MTEIYDPDLVFERVNCVMCEWYSPPSNKPHVLELAAQLHQQINAEHFVVFIPVERGGGGE